MKYTAITIGPILKTLQSVKSTKAIWAVSYMFSYLMKNIIMETKINPVDVLLPYYEETDLTDRFEVGLFPDRLIYKGEITNLETSIDNVITDFAKKASEYIDKSETEVCNYLKEYINIHHFDIELDNDELLPESNIIFKINSLLDTAELKQNIVTDADNNFLNLFFEKYKDGYNFLHINEFGKRKFKSTAEIATAEYSDKQFYKDAKNLVSRRDDYNDQIEYFKKIKENAGKQFKNYQKYIAVIQADGDNIGKFISALYNQNNAEYLVNKFSENLLTFGKESVKLINAYNGSPVYAGGDDLLYFCPVAHTFYNNETGKIEIKKTFLTLISEIDKVFKRLFNDNIEFKDIIAEVDKKPSMSYGVSISYYKFPLNEALENGINQLFYTAKKTKKKDAVSYSVLKHSRQQFGTTFHKNEKSYITYQKLLSENVEDENFLQGVVYKLEPQKMIFQSIALKNEVDRNITFDNFFKNNFDESVHTKKVNNKTELIDFLKTLKQLFKDVYSENEIKLTKTEVENIRNEFKTEIIDREKEKLIELKNERNLNKIYAALRFISFIHNKEER